MVLTFLGIDPGVSGGLAALTEDRELLVREMPDSEHDLWNWLNEYAAWPEDGNDFRTIATIEQVHAFPKQGVTSMFTFGRSYGLLRGMLVAASISFSEVTPRKWQKYLDISPKRQAESKPDFKRRLRNHAQRLFPRYSNVITAKVADAVLLAEYGRRQFSIENDGC